MNQFKAALAAVIVTGALNAQIYTARQGQTSVSFFSEAPLENIEATNPSAAVILKTNTNDIQISMNMNNFKFRNALMEEHFNENYIESQKYPKCTFKGRINETIDLTKKGETPVTVTGRMELHGVTRDVTISGLINNTGEGLALSSKFKIRVADYNIEVPNMYVKNIAEVVDVTFKSVLEPYQKK